MKFPTLYKKTSTGAIQFWTIFVQEQRGSIDGRAGVISTTYGQVGTNSPQTTSDLITEGKNIGKKNETTALKQAEKEAEARWKKQLKKGYVESIEAAQAEELDDLIEGGVVPMLAHKFADHGHKIKYPAAIQPKLDGIRCIAMVRNGRCTLWSRTRKPITSMPHIVATLEKHFKDNDITLDGELYNHSYKTNFEHIVSLVRQEEPDPRHTDVQYHVYDLVEDDMPFEGRIKKLNVAVGLKLAPTVIAVETAIVENEDAVMPIFNRYRAAGFEGAMLRNLNGKYVNKRSYDLLKVKEFDDAEFEIVGIDEGRGKLAGHVGAFICRTGDGKEFLAKMSGETARLRDLFTDHSLWRGKRLTVQYQGLTGSGGVPRFPVGIAIRDYE